MREIKNTLGIAKLRVRRLAGEEIKIVVDRGRNKTESFSGRITDVYPSIFTVREENGGSLASFSYSDLLTGNVRFYPADGKN